MLRSFLLSACLFAAIVAHAEVSPQCHSVSFEVKLDVYDDSEQSLGRNLLFRVQTLKEPGWFIDIVPADADDAGSVPLKTAMRTDQIVNSIRSVASRRGWAVSKIENNVVVLTLKHHGYDATLY